MHFHDGQICFVLRYSSAHKNKRDETSGTWLNLYLRKLKPFNAIKQGTPSAHLVAIVSQALFCGALINDSINILIFDFIHLDMYTLYPQRRVHYPIFCIQNDHGTISRWIWCSWCLSLLDTAHTPCINYNFITGQDSSKHT